MKKAAIYTLLTIIFFLLMQQISSVLETYKNMLLVMPVQPISEENASMFKLNMDENKYIKNLSLYTEPQKKSLHSGIREQEISVYGVDENYILFQKIQIINGRFILKLDCDKTSKSIVIDSQTAVKLFSRIDCIGNYIKIDQESYKIIGIYRKNNSFLNKISAADSYQAYIPYTNTITDNNLNANFLLTTDGILPDFLEQDISKCLGEIKESKIISIDENARMQLTKKNVSYILAFTILLIIICQKLYKNFLKSSYRMILNDADKYYTTELIKIHKFSILAMVALPVLITTASIYVYIYLNNGMYISPKLIPTRLINISEFLEKLQTYYIRRNTQLHAAVYTPYIKTVYSGQIINYLSIAFLLSVCGLVKTISRKETVKLWRSNSEKSTFGF